MPQPSYVGTSTWQRQPGAVSGIEGAIAFYEIPYRGKLADVPAFRTTWRRGTACPVPGFSHLSLLQGPTITEEAGGVGSAVLRFEGPDLNGEFGEDNDETTWFGERRSIAIVPAGIEDGNSTTYAFNAQIAVVTYTQDTKPTTASRSPSIEDPTFVGIESSVLRYPVAIEELVEGTDYEIVSTSTLMEINKKADNSYAVKEWHEKTFSAKGSSAQ